MSTDAFTATKDALLGLGGHRVWSLMVTLFGDLAQDEGRVIEGPVLSSVMAQMGIRPEAVRVALHRLRNDGWITSHKHGRTGHHALTSSGRAQSLEASGRIYGSAFCTGAAWSIALTRESDNPPRATMINAGYMPLLPRVYVGAQAANPLPDILRLGANSAPDWIKQEIATHLGQQEYTALLQVLYKAQAQLSNAQLSAVETAVMRCLIVHHWRRIILRHPPVPVSLLPDDWVGERCEVLVKTLLAHFKRPDLSGAGHDA